MRKNCAASVEDTEVSIVLINATLGEWKTALIGMMVVEIEANDCFTHVVPPFTLVYKASRRADVYTNTFELEPYRTSELKRIPDPVIDVALSSGVVNTPVCSQSVYKVMKEVV
jgi:hypothetical protein